MKYSNPNEFWKERRDLYDNDPIERGLRRAIKCLAVAAVTVLAVTILMSLFGCKAPKPSLSSSVRDSVRITDSIRIKDSVQTSIVRIYTDSVRIKDSTVVVLDSAGNVKHVKEYHSEKQHTTQIDSTAYYRNLFNDAVHELVKEREANKEVVVEKPLSAWQSFKIGYGGYAIAIVIGIFLLFIGRFVLGYYLGK